MSTLRIQQGLSLAWIDNPQDLAPLYDEWNALAEQMQAAIFLRPDWLDVWWRHFGKGKQMACLVAREKGKLIGVLPFCIDRIWLGPLPVRVARLAGTSHYSIIFHLPVKKDWTGAILEAAATHLTGTLDCLAISFTPVSDRAEYGSVLREVGRGGCGLLLQERGAGAHVICELPDRFETFFQALSKKRRSQFRRNTKGLKQSFDMASDCIVPTAAEFDEFIDLHNKQWWASGNGGHFVDWPGSGDFYRDLAASTSNQRWVRLDRLNGNTGPLAAEFSLVAGRTAYSYLPARSLDPEAKRLGVGNVIALNAIDRMIHDGITLVELGRGDYGNKMDYGGIRVPVHRMILRRDTTLSALHLKLLLAWADLLNLVYYRLWFQKIAYWLQQRGWRKPHPLWNGWILTRI